MRINILRLIPLDWMAEELDDGTCIVNYNKKRGNFQRKSFTLPQEILIDKQFMEGFALYLGDGDYNRTDKAHLTFASKDKDIARFFLEFLRKYFLIQNKDISFSLNYKKPRTAMKKEWCQLLQIGFNRILTFQKERHKEEVVHIQVNGVVFRKIFELVAKKVLRGNFLKKTDLRRAFLRGLFAAEGNIGIDYAEKDYISQISFSLSTKEAYLQKILCCALNLEGLRYRVTVYEKTSSWVLTLSNWENYLKLWCIGLFDACKRKKGQFSRIAYNLKVYCFLTDAFRKEFFCSVQLSQRAIAGVIGSWQGNVSRTIGGRHLLTIEQLMMLATHSRYGMNRVLQHVNGFRIGNLTTIEKDRDILFFLRRFKSV